MHCGRAFASPWLMAGKQLSLALVPLSPQEVGRLAALHMYVQSTCTEHVCRGDATLRTLETPSLPSAHPCQGLCGPTRGKDPSLESLPISHASIRHRVATISQPAPGGYAVLMHCHSRRRAGEARFNKNVITRP